MAESRNQGLRASPGGISPEQLRALQTLYFPKRRPHGKRLLRFSETYFGPNAGYAQQYLFHYMRTQAPPKSLLS